MIDISSWLQNGTLFSLNSSEILVSYGAVTRSNKPIIGGYYAPDFYLKSNEPWFKFEENHTLNKQGFLSEIRSSSTGNEVLDFNTFTHIQQGISKGSLNKLVPVVFEVSDISPSSGQLLNFICELLKVNTSQYIYGLWQNGEGLLGLTPEVLFNKKGSLLNSMALAGTDKVSSGDGSLLNNPKEMNEHSFVIEELKNQFKELGSVEQSRTYEWEINEIKHLRTDISVSLTTDCNPEAIVKSLHPTPALGIHPKEYNWHNIKNFETSVQRLRYGAPFGVSMTGGEFKSLVAIRNIQWDKNKSYIGSGCGIVKESEINKEWAELTLKRNSVKKYLGLIN